MKNYLRLLIILPVISISMGVNAQHNYKNGYIVTLKNDTVYGLINDGGTMKNSKVCLFKTDKKSTAIEYSPKDIKSYRFYGDKFYSSKEMFNNDEFAWVFTEVLLEGDLDLYYYSKNKELAYFLEKDSNLIGLVNKEVILNISSEGLRGLMTTDVYTPIESDNYFNQTNTSVYVDIYKDTLLSVFRDSEKIQDQIGDVKYTSKSLSKITKAYIYETCKENNCINYEKDFSQSRPSFGFFSGFSLSKISWESNVKSEYYNSVPIGIFLNLPLSLFNDRLSFQIELISNNSKHEQLYDNLLDSIDYMLIKSNTIGIPVLLKYEISKKRISPSIAFGKETGFVVNSSVRFVVNSSDVFNDYDDYQVHRIQKGGWFCEFGLNYKIAPKFSLFSNLRLQTNRNLIIPESSGSTTYSDAKEFDLFFTEYRTNILTLHVGMKF
jgi:hypothetical protein